MEKCLRISFLIYRLSTEAFLILTRPILSNEPLQVLLVHPAVRDRNREAIPDQSKYFDSGFRDTAKRKSNLRI